MADLSEFWKRVRSTNAVLLAEEDQLIERVNDMIASGRATPSDWSDMYRALQMSRKCDELPTADRIMALFGCIGYLEVMRRLGGDE